MSDIIILPLPNGEWIALTPDALIAARAAAHAAGFANANTHCPATGGGEPLSTSEELATALKVPQSRIEQLSRERKIPCVRIGRRVRFHRAEVEAALQALQRAKERT